MLLALLLAVAPVAQAERSFAEAAQRDGQWTAFRTYAAPDAILFAPEMMSASSALAGRADPPASVRWRSALTLTACDRSLAFTTGPRTGVTQGNFARIWRNGQGGWSWIYDGGHDGGADTGGGATIEQQTASCDGAPAAATAPEDPTDLPLLIDALRADASMRLIAASDGPLPATVRIGPVLASGGAQDRSLLWRINLAPDYAQGGHVLRVWAWDGRRYRVAVLDITGAPLAPTAPR